MIDTIKSIIHACLVGDKQNLLIFCCLYSFSATSVAHGPGQQSINNITTQLVEQGDSAQLYVKRAHILQNNQHWVEAMSDFNKAAALDPQYVDINLDRARLSYEAGDYLLALDYIDLYLLRIRKSTEAMIIKARTYRALSQYKNSAASYQQALADISDIDGSPYPEWYIEYSDTLMMDGDREKALQALLQGINELGAITVFQIKAIELEVGSELYDSALNRIEQLLNQSQRKDIWLTRRADVLYKAGRHDEAMQTYQQAYSALQELPPRLRNLPVSRELLVKLQTKIITQ